MKKNITFVKMIFAAILLMFVMTGCVQRQEISTTKQKTARSYECDYHTLAFKTHISTTVDGKEVHITGRLITFWTDPLTMKDTKGNVIGSASDKYHFITQDDHTIYVGDKAEVVLCGNFEMWGNSYDLYDTNGVKIGFAEFNDFCTLGNIYDANGSVAAVYEKNYFLNDYTVTIYDNNICSDKAMLLVIASYVSDYHYDEENQNNSNSSSSSSSN